MVIFCHQSWVQEQPASVDILLWPLLRKQELCECIYIYQIPSTVLSLCKSTEQE